MKLHLKCPKCGGHVAPISAFYLATSVDYRTCRKCRAKWCVVIDVLERNDKLEVRRLEWTCIRDAARSRAAEFLAGSES